VHGVTGEVMARARPSSGVAVMRVPPGTSTMPSSGTWVMGFRPFTDALNSVGARVLGGLHVAALLGGDALHMPSASRIQTPRRSRGHHPVSRRRHRHPPHSLPRAGQDLHRSRLRRHRAQPDPAGHLVGMVVPLDRTRPATSLSPPDHELTTWVDLHDQLFPARRGGVLPTRHQLDRTAPRLVTATTKVFSDRR
jgi:hypothetical protein